MTGNVTKQDREVLFIRCRNYCASELAFTPDASLPSVLFHLVRGLDAETTGRVEGFSIEQVNSSRQKLYKKFNLNHSIADSLPQTQREDIFRVLNEATVRFASRWLNRRLTTDSAEISVASLGISAYRKRRAQDQVRALPPVASKLGRAVDKTVSDAIKPPPTPKLLIDNDKNIELKEYLLWLNIRFALAGLSYQNLTDSLENAPGCRMCYEKLGILSADPDQPLVALLKQYRQQKKLPMDPNAARKIIAKLWGVAAENLPQKLRDQTLAQYLGLDSTVTNPSDWLGACFKKFCTPLPPAKTPTRLEDHPLAAERGTR